MIEPRHERGLRAFSRRFHRSPSAVSAIRPKVSPAPMGVGELDLIPSVNPDAIDFSMANTLLLIRAGRHPIGWALIERDGTGGPADWLGRALVELAPRLAAAVALARTRPVRSVPLPPISIVICTRNRADSLERCLISIGALDYPEFEVVVVDNAPDSDATARLVGRCGVRYEREDRPGLDWARNRGIAAARHDFVAFTDDDVRVDRHWLRALAEAFARPGVGVVTGLVAPASLRTPSEQLFEQGYGGMGKGFVPREIVPADAEPRELLGTHHLGVGANMAFRREVLERIGGFDTALDVGTATHGGGDLDAFHRALLAGAVARYEPSALVWHHHRQTIPELRRQMYDNGRAFGAYLLTRTRDRRLPRGAVVAYAARWFMWLLGRIPRRFLRRERMPVPFILSELWGATHAPWGYLRARRRDRVLRSSAPDRARVERD